MKYCHLVAALALAGCGLNTSALPSTGGSSDAGIHSAESLEDQSSAGFPATWPTRRRPAQSVADAGSGDTRDASSGPAQPNHGGSSAERDAPQTDPNDQVPAEPGSAANPGQAPISSGGSAQPGAGQAPASGSSSHNEPSGSSTQTGNGTPDTGSPMPEEPDAEEDPDGDDSADESAPAANGGQSSNGNGNKDKGKDKDKDGNSGNGNGKNGKGNDNDNDTVSGIVELVIALLDVSLGPVRPAELEQLVSSLLVLSLAPADLAAESLVAVLDALEDTQICVDHPERCNPLCTNLESDCSACGKDLDCIDRIEEMCNVKLPKNCL